MLDVITDFWKPVKKSTAQEKPDLDRLQLGSGVVFGTVPQAVLSNKSFRVTAVNTYQFGEERMTSFVLTGEREESVSLIIAQAEGEQYLAISRRIAFADRMRMFDPAEIEAVVEQKDVAKLACREIDASWRHWLVGAYKKEISNLKGAVLKGDFRYQTPSQALSQPFDYVLLTSENNEYAIEVERYADGRQEFYATVYRRVGDIVAMENPPGVEVPPARTSTPVLEMVKAEPATEAQEAASPAPAAIAATKEEAAPRAPEVKKPEAPVAPPPPAPSFPALVTSHTTETRTMPQGPTANNGSANESPRVSGFSAPVKHQEIKAVNTRAAEFENDAIECDLRVANKIIEEAIRNEMRLSDIVRRIIALPVANPESVQIPVTLSDTDFQLLAVRYGLPAADRNAIKARIIEEMNDFSGNGKQKSN